jgi:hypothetical protein
MNNRPLAATPTPEAFGEGATLNHPSVVADVRHDGHEAILAINFSTMTSQPRRFSVF